MDLVDEAVRRLTLLLSSLLDQAYAAADTWHFDVSALDWCDERLHDLVVWRLSRRPNAREELRQATEAVLEELVREARVDFRADGISVAPRLHVVGGA